MTATQIFPLEVWTSQITQASIPANNNALRVEVLESPAIAIANSPSSSNEDDIFIVGDTPAGDFSTFTSNNVVIYKGGTWLEFEVFAGWIKTVGTDLYYFDGTNWNEFESGGGGGSTFAPVVEITASETLAIGRSGKFINANHASTPIAITVPPNSSVAFSVDAEIHIRQSGDAQVSIIADTGVTIQQPASQTLNLKEKYSVVTLKKVATNTWALFGMLENV